jgi:hypothetical protein
MDDEYGRCRIKKFRVEIIYKTVFGQNLKKPVFILVPQRRLL